MSDDEAPINGHLDNLLFSTPVSSQKTQRRDGGQLGKLKNTRFVLPSSIDQPKPKYSSSESILLRYNNLRVTINIFK